MIFLMFIPVMQTSETTILAHPSVLLYWKGKAELDEPLEFVVEPTN